MSSHRFRFATEATPEQVWTTLTDPDLTARYLHVALEATWQPAASLVATAASGAYLEGDVIAIQSPVLLSYALAAGANQPSTYLTWDIRRRDGGAVVRLYVDEPEETLQPNDDDEDVWLDVIGALQSLLREQPSTPSTGTLIPSPPDRPPWPT